MNISQDDIIVEIPLGKVRRGKNREEYKNGIWRI
jgi:hypothetical protein